MNASIHDIIGRVPSWRSARAIEIGAEPIGSGLTNANYHVRVDGAPFVLRVGGENAAVLGINRQTEHDALMAVSAVGIAPEVILFTLPEGHLITRFIEGHDWTRDEFKQPAVIARVADTMRRVHSLPEIAGGFSPYRDIERRLREVRDRAGASPEPAALERYLDTLYQIEAERAADHRYPPALCHNDPFANNFLDDGMVRLLDWEFAGMGDIFYDLASVCFSFSPDQEAHFLRCYFGAARPEDAQIIEQMRFVIAFWNATWALLQASIWPTGHDYMAMAERLLAVMDRRLGA